MKNSNGKYPGKIIRIWNNKTFQDKLFIIIIAFSYLLFFAVLVFSNQFQSIYSKVNFVDFETGKVADRNLIVDRDITYIDYKATTLKADAREKLALDVFTVRDDFSQRSVNNFKIFSSSFLKLHDEAFSNKKIFLEIQTELPGVFIINDINLLTSFKNNREILKISEELLEYVMTEGIVSLPENIPVSGKHIEILRWRKGLKEREEKRIDLLLQKNNLKTFLNNYLSTKGLDERNILIITSLIEKFAIENTFYDKEKTEMNQERARDEVEPVVKKLLKGEQIIKKGFIITEEDMIKVNALGNYSTTVNINSIIGTTLFLLLIYLISFTLLNPPITASKLKRKNKYLLLSMAFIYVMLSVILLRFPILPEWIPSSVLLPTALIAMLISTIINPRVSILFTLIISLSLFLSSGNNAYSFIFAFISGIIGTIVILGAEKRIELIKATLLLAVLNSLLLVSLGFLQNYSASRLFIAAGWGILNGFLCGVLNLAFLPLLEHILNAPTAFRLMELSDINNPLFKRMLVLAPGTYGHTISVANLAESACREIGANALLARAGAYYHDIGKIDQAEYFIENQTSINKHDELRPSLSASVIKSHVKIGVEKAKELDLPQEVIDIIAQHHGSGLISYFYMQAIKEKSDSKITPEDFSYTGTPPTSREAAVVMLADSVEAASRTFKKPTVAKLDKFIWSIIMDKISSEQMQNCSLTFNNLKIIKNTFIYILAGHFHTRIEYPSMKEQKIE